MNGLYGEGIDSPYYWGRCRRFPWLPRWWWAMPATPYTPPVYAPPAWTEEQELAMLESHRALLREQLEQIKKRLEEVKK